MPLSRAFFSRSFQVFCPQCPFDDQAVIPIHFVGCDAAPLLGDQISVSTRHFTEKNRIEFDCDLQTSPIDIRHFQRPVGTSIKIKLAPDVLHKLISGPGTWDWFKWSKPRVERFINGVLQPNNDFVPRTAEDAFPDWTWFQGGTQTVYWRPRLTQTVFCNGIPVDQGHSGLRSWGDSEDTDKLQVNWPELAISDPEGSVPLDLSRIRFLTRSMAIEHATL